MVWHQETPNGTLAVVYLETDDVPASMQPMATSDDPLDQWFRKLPKEVHGIDLTEGWAYPELVHGASFKANLNASASCFGGGSASSSTGVPANCERMPSIQSRQRSVNSLSSVCMRARVTRIPRSAPLYR